jgi:hypothetical protein
MTSLLDPTSVDLWTRPEPRLPHLKKWLLEEVWTTERFKGCGAAPAEYLKTGEKMVNEKEALLTAAADSYFKELATAQAPAKTIVEFFDKYINGAVVIFDGCSLRELPRLLELAKSSRRPVVECTCGRSALPSTTEHFINDRLGLDLPVVAPSELVSRRELRDHGIRYYFFQKPNEFQHISEESVPILLWHRFPDLRFMDSAASSAEMYDGMWDALGTVWKNSVQALPAKRNVLVTSDHGYVFFGAGLSDTNLEHADRPLQGKRFREFSDNEPFPEEGTLGLFLDRQRRTAILQGRCHNRPQAPSPSKSLYRHGGLSLMEVLTPWLVLGPME